MKTHSSEHFKLTLHLPLKTRGRPRLLKTNDKHPRNSRRIYWHSNLAQLHHEKKITTEQFNAGETFLWLLREVRKNIPVPSIAKNKYQERIKGIMWDMGLKNEERQKQIFRWWRDSMIALKAAGGTTKTLIEDFIYHNERPSQSLSEVELQLIKRGLDYLGSVYKR